MSLNGDTRPVREGEELPLEQLGIFLHKTGLMANLGGAIDVEQFPGGFSNLTYLLKIEDGEFVLRRPPRGVQVKKGHDMGREFEVLSKLHTVFPKAPKAFAFSGDETIIGAPFYIMERVRGVILRKKEVERLNILPGQFETIAQSWLKTLAELHKADYSQAGLSNLGRPEGYVERQVTIWSKQYLKAATEDVPAAAKVMRWMLEKQPSEYDYSLIHNDYKYDNIVFAEGDWEKVIAVLDWEMTTIGDPLMDLGTSLGYWILGSDPEIMRRGLDVPTAFSGNPSRTEVVEGYARETGRPIRNLVFYYVYGLFKIAVIAQQIYYRYNLGYTKDPRFAPLNKVAEQFCNFAWRAIQKQSID